MDPRRLRSRRPPQLWDLRWPFTFGAKRRLAGLRITATDTDWAIGSGPEVAGPIKAILLLLTGRTGTAAGMLHGDGLRRLVPA